MERLIQYLDELEDLIFAAPLIAEQIRAAIRRIAFLVASIGLQAAGILLALNHPPLAMAIVTLLIVGLLMRAVVAPRPRAVAAH